MGAAVAGGRGAGIVLGDLRASNVLVSGEVRVVGFQWAGKVGEARYPCDIVLNDRWHKGVRRGGLIEKVYDWRLLEKVIAAEVRGGLVVIPYWTWWIPSRSNRHRIPLVSIVPGYTV